MPRFIIVAVLMLWVPAAGAATADAVTLRVKPVLCITENREAGCPVSFDVSWASESAGHYCLYNDFSDAPLDCWSDHSAGAFREDRVVARSFTWWLAAAGLELRAAESVFEVMTTESSDRRRNRRHRHAWSIL